MEKTPLLKTNLDTNFLKLIAIISMLIDHVGIVFFPEYPVFRWIGRLAFPLFCYCMTVGLLYTHDASKYLVRLAVFALVLQPFYIIVKNSQNIAVGFADWNIFFTLFLSLLAMWGFKERKWWLFIVGVLVVSFFNFDYSYTGVILMLIFYLCRQKPALGVALYVVSYISQAILSGVLDSPSMLHIGGYAFGFQIFALLALPLIFARTKVSTKIPKQFFYTFYPAHLVVIGLVQLLLDA